MGKKEKKKKMEKRKKREKRKREMFTDVNTLIIDMHSLDIMN